MCLKTNKNQFPLLELSSSWQTPRVVPLGIHCAARAGGFCVPALGWRAGGSWLPAGPKKPWPCLVATASWKDQDTCLDPLTKSFPLPVPLPLYTPLYVPPTSPGPEPDQPPGIPRARLPPSLPGAAHFPTQGTTRAVIPFSRARDKGSKGLCPQPRS